MASASQRSAGLTTAGAGGHQGCIVRVGLRCDGARAAGDHCRDPMRKSALRLIASTGPWLAPVLSAFFIGRSIYLHLLLQWQVEVVRISPAVNLAVAVIAGASVEVLAIVSVHNCLALHRWNDQGRVQKQKGGWEKAPLWLAITCAGAYVATAVLLLVVLEAVPELAQYAPILFPMLAIVGAINLVVLNQHQDRLERYGLGWDLSATHKRPAATKRATVSESASDRDRICERIASEAATESDEGRLLVCNQCDWKRPVSGYESDEAAQNALNAHHGWHTRRERSEREKRD